VLDSRKRNLQGPLGFCPVALLVRAYIGFLAFVSLSSGLLSFIMFGESHETLMRFGCSCRLCLVMADFVCRFAG